MMQSQLAEQVLCSLSGIESVFPFSTKETYLMAALALYCSEEYQLGWVAPRQIINSNTMAWSFGLRSWVLSHQHINWCAFTRFEGSGILQWEKARCG